MYHTAIRTRASNTICDESKFKRDLCIKFRFHGFCNYGKRCQFAHGKQDQITYKKDAWIPLCTHFVKNLDNVDLEVITAFSETISDVTSETASDTFSDTSEIKPIIRRDFDNDSEWAHFDDMIELILSDQTGTGEEDR